ncbi:MAG: hypothetical protein LCH38_10080 [Proteobacteria bacterium]|nr:hypothetical protein [Pseudomonadota bacterium]
MVSPRMKSLENCAHATGSAFGFEEADFEVRYTPPARPGRFMALMLTVGGGVAVLAHHFGWTQVVATFGGWRSAV